MAEARAVRWVARGAAASSLQVVRGAAAVVAVVAVMEAVTVVLEAVVAPLAEVKEAEPRGATAGEVVRIPSRWSQWLQVDR